MVTGQVPVTGFGGGGSLCSGITSNDLLVGNGGNDLPVGSFGVTGTGGFVTGNGLLAFGLGGPGFNGGFNGNTPVGFASGS